MKDEITEGARVGGVGLLGLIASMTLADVSVLVSIFVGLATLAYILSKLYFLFKNEGRSRDE